MKKINEGRMLTLKTWQIRAYSIYLHGLQHEKTYIECNKIPYTKVSDKTAYANSADPDQTAPEGAV